MLDMSWGEVMVIGAVALIVIGPKDLPRALRTVGQMTGKIRRMAAEFQGQFNEAMREAELDDVKRQIQGVSDSVGPNFNPIQTIRDELKGAVEGTGSPTAASNVSTPGITVSDAPALPIENAAAPPAMSPSLDLPAPSLPPVADPAVTVAEAVQKSAAAPSPVREPQIAPPPASQIAAVKPSEKAE